MKEEYEDGVRHEYRLDGNLHRVNGPARIWKANGAWSWWQRGRYNRYYGPQNASNGTWWINGVRVKQ